jgi:hypothetical protein
VFVKFLYQQRKQRFALNRKRKKILTNKAVVRTNADFKYKIHEFTADSLYFTDGKTLTAPKDIFSAFIDPLQQILKSHRKLKH